MARGQRLFDIEIDRWRRTLDLRADPMGPTGTGRFVINCRPDHLTVLFGDEGSPDTLGETRAYRRAKRVLGGPPTTLLRMRPFLRAYGVTGDLGPAARLDLVAAREKRLPGGGLLQRYMLGLNPDAPTGDPPELQEPATEPAAASLRRSGAGDAWPFG
jgi:hypothetical protein